MSLVGDSIKQDLPKRERLIVLESGVWSLEAERTSVEVHVKFQAPLASPGANKGKRPSPSLPTSNHVSHRSQFQLSMS